MASELSGIEPYDPTITADSLDGSIIRNPMSLIYWLQIADRAPKSYLHSAGTTSVHIYNNGAPAKFLVVDTDQWTIHQFGFVRLLSFSFHNLQVLRSFVRGAMVVCVCVCACVHVCSKCRVHFELLTVWHMNVSFIDRVELKGRANLI